MTFIFCHLLKEILNRFRVETGEKALQVKSTFWANIRPSPHGLGDIKEERKEKNLRNRGWERTL